MTEPAPRTWRPTPLLWFSATLHLAAGVAIAATPGRWPWIAGTIFADHMLIAAAGMWPRGHWLGPNLTRLPASPEPRVALTFDDGPDPRVTPRVLDLLDAYSATATFFCIGHRAESCPDVAAEVARRGHRLENHTYRHPNTFAFYLPAAMGREIDRTQEVLARAGGRRPVYFRAPAGIRNPWLEILLARRGLSLASWSRRGYDTVRRDPRRVARRLLHGLADGDVALLHDGSSARDHRGRPIVLEVLPRLLDQLGEHGLRGVALPDPEPEMHGPRR